MSILLIIKTKKILTSSALLHLEPPYLGSLLVCICEPKRVHFRATLLHRDRDTLKTHWEHDPYPLCSEYTPISLRLADLLRLQLHHECAPLNCDDWSHGWDSGWPWLPSSCKRAASRPTAPICGSCQSQSADWVPLSPLDPPSAQYLLLFEDKAQWTLYRARCAEIPYSLRNWHPADSQLHWEQLPHSWLNQSALWLWAGRQLTSYQV